MTRDTGQITTRQALAATGVLTLAVAAVVAGLGQLVRPGDQLPALVAPAGDEAPCPDPPTAPRDEPVAVTADRFLECPRAYDGQRVTYQGEAVRAVLVRDDRAWLHLNDDPYALDLGPLPEHRTAVGGNSGIPVYVPRDVADEIAYVGNARARGDLVTVTGVFYRAHPSDAGAPAIHADTARIDRAGVRLAEPGDPRRAVTAGVLAVLAVVSVLAARRSRTVM